MTEDVIPGLARFHREIVLPDVRRVVEESERRIRDEGHSLFDGLAQRLERLEIEARVDGLQGQLRILEERLAE